MVSNPDDYLPVHQKVADQFCEQGGKAKSFVDQNHQSLVPQTVEGATDVPGHHCHLMSLLRSYFSTGIFVR